MGETPKVKPGDLVPFKDVSAVDVVNTAFADKGVNISVDEAAKTIDQMAAWTPDKPADWNATIGNTVVDVRAHQSAKK